MSKIVSYGFISLLTLACADRALAATELLLHDFAGGSDGVYPQGEVLVSSGTLYGTASNGGQGYNGMVYALVPSKGSWTEQTLYSFTGLSDGSTPTGDLIADNSGALYGLTYGGGGGECANGGCGSAYKLTPNSSSPTGWTKTTIYIFGGGAGDGAHPFGSGLIFGPDGSLYGTTSEGGKGFGTVFKLTPSSDPSGFWTETQLYSFKGGIDGNQPMSGVVYDNGVLYGTTAFGGLQDNGTVFELTPPASGETQWTNTQIYRFHDKGDGAIPLAGLIEKNGVLFGTAAIGGDAQNGVVFSLSPPSSGTAWQETVLHRFRGGNDGAVPGARLTMDANGNLYGTAESGGVEGETPGHGIVFELIAPAAPGGQWTEKFLHRFVDAGNNPASGVSFDSSGNLYGTKMYGSDRTGGPGYGFVYRVTP